MTDEHDQFSAFGYGKLPGFLVPLTTVRVQPAHDGETLKSVVVMYINRDMSEELSAEEIGLILGAPDDADHIADMIRDAAAAARARDLPT